MNSKCCDLYFYNTSKIYINIYILFIIYVGGPKQNFTLGSLATLQKMLLTTQKYNYFYGKKIHFQCKVP